MIKSSIFALEKARGRHQKNFFMIDSCIADQEHGLCNLYES